MKKGFASPQAGFTLIELLIIIAIIGLLTVLAVISLNSSREQARDVKRVANIATLQRALEMYLDKGLGYPVSNGQGAGKGECVINPSVGIGKIFRDSGVILSEVPQDPLWPIVAPNLFNDNIKEDYPVNTSSNFCYWYYGTADQYYLSYYLETNSKSGEKGIHVITLP